MSTQAQPLAAAAAAEPAVQVGRGGAAPLFAGPAALGVIHRTGVQGDSHVSYNSLLRRRDELDADEALLRVDLEDLGGDAGAEVGRVLGDALLLGPVREGRLLGLEDERVRELEDVDGE